LVININLKKNRYVDNLPAGFNKTDGMLDFNKSNYESGIPLGNINDVYKLI